MVRRSNSSPDAERGAIWAKVTRMIRRIAHAIRQRGTARRGWPQVVEICDSFANYYSNFHRLSPAGPDEENLSSMFSEREGAAAADGNGTASASATAPYCHQTGWLVFRNTKEWPNKRTVHIVGYFVLSHCLFTNCRFRRQSREAGTREASAGIPIPSGCGILKLEEFDAWVTIAHPGLVCRPCPSFLLHPGHSRG